MPDKSISGIICTHTGKTIDVLCPKIEDIDIEDIAHSLSLQCRYGGRCERFYSVAEHCLTMSCCDFLPGRPLAKLLHDASEAYVGDVVRGIKMLLPEYQRIENEFHRLIGLKFGVTPDEFAAVKTADNVMLMTEANVLMSRAYSCFEQNFTERPDSRIGLLMLNPEDAEVEYLYRFRQLTEN